MGWEIYGIMGVTLAPSPMDSSPHFPITEVHNILRDLWTVLDKARDQTGQLIRDTDGHSIEGWVHIVESNPSWELPTEPIPKVHKTVQDLADVITTIRCPETGIVVDYVGSNFTGLLSANIVNNPRFSIATYNVGITVAHQDDAEEKLERYLNWFTSISNSLKPYNLRSC